MANTDTFREQTRATKFQQKFTLPPDFADVLKEYTREALRKQPVDIYEWSSQYFAQLALKEDGVEAKAVGGSAASIPESYQQLASMLEGAFAEYDSAAAEQRSGSLFPHIMKRVLIDSAGLTPAQAMFVLSSPSVKVAEATGTIRYADVAANPAIIQQIAFFQKTGHEFDAPSADATAHGLSLEELQAELSTVFSAMASGRDLTLAAYVKALKTAPVQLTARDINLLVLETPLDGDGHVQIGEYQNIFNLICQSEMFTQFEQHVE